MSIRCGNCHQRHARVADVRACYAETDEILAEVAHVQSRQMIRDLEEMLVDETQDTGLTAEQAEKEYWEEEREERLHQAQIARMRSVDVIYGRVADWRL